MFSVKYENHNINIGVRLEILAYNIIILTAGQITISSISDI